MVEGAVVGGEVEAKPERWWWWGRAMDGGVGGADVDEVAGEGEIAQRGGRGEGLLEQERGLEE